MIAIVQRISEASVTVDGELISSCSGGLAVLLGVADGDEDRDARLLADKIAKLRIFSDENDKLNLSVVDVRGSVMVVPNFTLLASYRKGNRPDYLKAAAPAEAERLYELFVSYMRESVENVVTGKFGEHMKFSLVNDGPITIPMDSNVLKQSKNA